MTVLILARDLDPSADAMISALHDRGVETLRINTAWFPTEVRLTARMRSGRWGGALHAPHGSVELEQVSAVWYRSPEAYRMPTQMSAAEAGHARVEAKYGLGGVLASLPVRWCNHPARIADAAYKPVQLVRAGSCGLTVPDTVITNDADTVRAFAAEQPGPLVTKLVGGMVLDEQGARKNVFTRRVDPADLDNLAGVEHTAHLFQAWVPKHSEVRMIVIGDQITAAQISAHSTAAHVDYRCDYAALTYDLIDPPPHVVAGVRDLMFDLGLLYGALDFVLTPDGRWVFLELNPAGQYGWIETATAAPLTAQLANLLAGGAA